MERTSDFDKLPFLYMTMAKALAWNRVVPTETLTIVSLTDGITFCMSKTDLYKRNDGAVFFFIPFREHGGGFSSH